MALRDLVGEAPRLEKIAGGLATPGGLAFSRHGYLLFSDPSARRILRWDKGAITVERAASNGAFGLTFDHHGRLLACEAGRVTRSDGDGRISVLADRLDRPRDVVYAIDGSIYFTDRGVHQITRRGTVRLVAADCPAARAVALARDQQKLYVSDGAGRGVRVYDIAPDGALGRGRVLVDGLARTPEGLKTDEDGNLWIAVGTGIQVFDARGGRLGEIPVPEEAGQCGWGDGFTALYIAAATAIYRLPTKAHGTRTY